MLGPSGISSARYSAQIYYQADKQMRKLIFSSFPVIKCASYYLRSAVTA